MSLGDTNTVDIPALCITKYVVTSLGDKNTANIPTLRAVISTCSPRDYRPGLYGPVSGEGWIGLPSVEQ